MHVRFFKMAPEGDNGSAGGASGGAAGNAGAGNANDKGGAGGNAGSRTINPDDHDRALADLHKYKGKATELEQRLTAIERERENEKTRKLQEQGEFKTLAEQYQKERDDAKKEADTLKSAYVDDKKFDKVRAACEKLGLRSEAIADLEMLDLNGVSVETTSTGKIIVHGADKFAEAVKAKKPHWFTGPKAPNVDTNGTRVLDGSAGGTVTARDLLNAETEGKKSGDMSKYRKLFAQYQAQRAGKKPA
jgi:hypothetical protein